MMGWDGISSTTNQQVYSQRPVQYAGISSGDTSLSIATRTSNHSDPNANSLGTGSSHSNSPYTSASSLVSPVYDNTGGMTMGLGPLAAQQQQMPLVQGQWTASQPVNMGPPPSLHGASTYGQESMYDHHPHQQYQTSTAYQNIQGIEFVHMQGQSQSQAGGYVYQPDGSQLFVPYDQE